MAALATLAIVALALVAVGGLAWQASRDSLSLNALRGRIEAAIRGRLPADAEVAIGSAAVSYRGGSGLVVQAQDVSLRLPGLGSVNAARIATVATPLALLSGRVELRSVTVSGVEIAFAATPGSASTGSGADLVRRAAMDSVRIVGESDDAMRGAGLAEVDIRDAALRLLGGPKDRGPALAVGEASWRPLGPERSKVWLQVEEPQGASWTLTLQRERAPDGGASVSVDVADLPVEALAPGLPRSHDEAGLHSALSLQARVAAGSDGGFREIRGLLSSGRGVLSFGGSDRIPLVGAALSFALGASGDRIAIPGGEVSGEDGSLMFEGVADLGEPGGVTLVGRVRGGFLPTVGRKDPVRLTGGGLLARVDYSDLGLDVERLALTTPDGTVSLVGQASLGGRNPGLSFALSTTELPLAVARAFWPPFVAAKAREWFDENVRSGILGASSLRVALPPESLGSRGKDKVLPSYALVGSLPFKDAEFTPLRTLPPITRAAGEIAFSDATATISAQSATIRLPGKGDIDALGSALIIPQLGRPRPYGNLHLELAGPAAALAALSNMPPLAIAAERGIKAEALSGDAQLSLDADVPLMSKPGRDIGAAFRLALHNFSSSAPIENRLIAKADLVLEGTADSFTVRGKGTLDGIEASVDLILGSAVSDQTAVTLSLDEAARERLGLTLGGVVSGPIKASLKESEAGAGQEVALDLKDTRINLSFLGWEKGPGVPATARFVLRKSNGGTRVSDLVLSGKGFSAKGALSVGPKGELVDLDLTEVALRPGDRVAVSASAGPNGYDVRVRGEALDLRGVLRSLGSGLSGGKTKMRPVRVAVDVSEVTGQNGAVLTDLSGTLRIGRIGLDAASLRGNTETGKSFEWTLGSADGARVLRLFARDGGALIRFVGLYGKIVGGTLVLDYSGPLGGAGSGVLVLRDFRVLDEGALSPAVGSGGGAGDPRIVRPVAAGAGEMTFSQLKIPFRQKDWVIAIDDAALRGPMLGATATGTVNLPGAKMAISGTFIPAFGINNIAGAIPLIGGILGGGRDEGLLGITYKLFGPINSPKLTMNPVSAIAPGIFRRIFQYN